jgi:hypothetical protein
MEQDCTKEKSQIIALCNFAGTRDFGCVKQHSFWITKSDEAITSIIIDMLHTGSCVV